MKEIIVIFFLLAGTVFIFLAAIGIMRMPDIYIRMSAATKATTLGVGFMLLAIAVHFGDMGISTRAIGAIVFLFLTMPIGAHVISRAAYFTGIKLWERNIVDEMKGQYNPDSHELGSADVEEVE
jgi:multicomponent Na+:H+ antiporter subunit G